MFPCHLLRGFVFIEADVVLLAEQLEHAHYGCMRLTFAALVFGEGVGVHPQLLGHLVLEEIELPACDQQLFSET